MRLGGDLFEGKTSFTLKIGFESNPNINFKNTHGTGFILHNYPFPSGVIPFQILWATNILNMFSGYYNILKKAFLSLTLIEGLILDECNIY